VELNFNSSIQEPKSFEEHLDYRTNLKWSLQWLKANESDLPEGIRVMFTSMEKARQLLTFMFRPPRDWPGCGFANHVSLQQAEYTFNPEVHKTYDFYKRMTNYNYYQKLING
jgi:predicted dithiol-disulfide oxidoreductase (DUF899 family)